MNNDEPMNTDEPRPDRPAPTPEELEADAEKMAAIYRAMARAAREPMELRFGPKSGKLSRNSPCPCGSGRKYKRCCMAKVDAGQYKRLAVDGPVERRQPRTIVGPSRGVRKYIRRKLAELTARQAAKDERNDDAS